MFEVIFYGTPGGRSPVREWILELPKSHRREIGGALFSLQKLGPGLGMPLSKSLGKGLHELRVPCPSVTYRVFYSFVKGEIVVLLHGITKKSQKTPKKDLELARKRLTEYLAKE